MRNIIITDTSAAEPVVAQKPHFDLQDGLLVLGVLLLEAGVAMIYLPAALMLAGVMCFASAALIEKAKRAGKS